ncbi:MAG: asparagine synthase-related protein [Pseudonocardiaceae bacterium]
MASPGGWTGTATWTVFALFAHTPGHGVFRGLRELRPGRLLRVTRSATTESRYWQLRSAPHLDDLDTTVATVRGLLEDTVERQLISDVPLCTLLSGGVDSSALTALAARALDGAVTSFSVDFRGSEADFRPTPIRPSLDGPFVRRMVEHLGTRHSAIELDTADVVASAGIPLRARDLPGTGDFDISLYLLFREVTRHATVALSGESADEVFGGYPWYRDEQVLAADTFPWFARSRRPAELLHDDIRKRIRPAEYEAQRYAEALAEVPRLDGETGRARRLREICYLDFTRQLGLLLDRKDRMSMLVGLEVRVPFCDHPPRRAAHPAARSPPTAGSGCPTCSTSTPGYAPTKSTSASPPASRPTAVSTPGLAPDDRLTLHPGVARIPVLDRLDQALTTRLPD